MMLDNASMVRTGRVKPLPPGPLRMHVECAVDEIRAESFDNLIEFEYIATYKRAGHCKAGDAAYLERDFRLALQREIYGDLYDLLLDLRHAEYGHDIERVGVIRKKMEELTGLNL